MFTTLRHRANCTLLALLFFAIAQQARAVPLLTLTPSQSTFFVAAGGQFTVYGGIINRTNTGLDATDLFLDFSNFAPDVLIPEQGLGQVPFHIPSFSQANYLALFTVAVAPGATPGPQSLDVLLQDVYGNVADVTAITVMVDVPEPAALTMLLAGLPVLIWRRRHLARKGGHHA